MKKFHSAEKPNLDHRPHPNIAALEKETPQIDSDSGKFIEGTDRLRNNKIDKQASLDVHLFEALVLAKKAELNQTNDPSIKKANSLKSSPSKKQRKAVFYEQMKNVQKELSFSEKIVSQMIHNQLIEKTSDFFGSTIARPNALLSGSVAAFFGIIICYVIAHYYGYKLSGFETIIAFIVGWLMGLSYDFVSDRLRRNR